MTPLSSSLPYCFRYISGIKKNGKLWVTAQPESFCMLVRIGGIWNCTGHLISRATNYSPTKCQPCNNKSGLHCCCAMPMYHHFHIPSLGWPPQQAWKSHPLLIKLRGGQAATGQEQKAQRAPHTIQVGLKRGAFQQPPLLKGEEGGKT